MTNSDILAFNHKQRTHFNTLCEKLFDGNKRNESYFESVPCCYICECEEIFTEFTVNNFRFVRCSNCGAVYVNPRLKHDYYNEIQQKWGQYFKIKVIPSAQLRKEIYGNNKYLLVAKYFENQGAILDIGSGIGLELSIFKEKGWDCYGVEPNIFAANYARKHFGLNIANTDIESFVPDRQFDLITSFGVLPIFKDPVSVLRKIKNCLAPGGYICMEMSAADSVLVRYYENGGAGYVDRGGLEGEKQLMLYSIKSINLLAEKTSCRCVEMKTDGLDMITLNRLFLNSEIPDPQIKKLQKLLDSSLQGDRIRVVLRPEK